MFFLTPAFAHWVLDDNIFLRHAVNRIFRRVVDGSITRHSGMKVHTVVAVVDKLPTPSPVHDLGALEAGAMHRMRTPPVGDVGSEGMAYVTLNASAVQFKERASPDEESTITLVTSRNAESQTVEVPLAETIFQTGTPTTMFRSSWSKPEENIPMDRVAKIDLGRLILRLCQDKGAEQCSALAVPLIPLTFPRIVKSGMGNIVRQFVGPEGDAVTASGELEKVVPQYTKSRNEPPQAMQVWALVIPQHVSKSVQDKTYELLEDTREIQSDSSERVWARLWARDPPKWTGIVPLALSKGARLHRVLSGGGGWGKKAGLLSLDPSVHVAKPASRDDAGEYDALAELSASMQPVVHPGDSIQFFASPPDGKGSGNPELTPVLRPWMWEWGTIPSTIDERSKSWQYAPSSASHVIHHFRGVFGALSEAGFTLKQRELGESDSGEDLTVEHTTKVDVPFSRFSVINLGRRDKQEESLPGQQVGSQESAKQL